MYSKRDPHRNTVKTSKKTPEAIEADCHRRVVAAYSSRSQRQPMDNRLDKEEKTKQRRPAGFADMAVEIVHHRVSLIHDRRSVKYVTVFNESIS